MRALKILPLPPQESQEASPAFPDVWKRLGFNPSAAREVSPPVGLLRSFDVQVEFLAVLTQQLRLYETTSPRLVTRRLRPASEVPGRNVVCFRWGLFGRPTKHAKPGPVIDQQAYL